MNSEFIPGYFYYLNGTNDGLAIGEHRGHYKLFRVYWQDDRRLFHYCIAVMPEYKHAVILMEYLEEAFGPVLGTPRRCH